MGAKRANLKNNVYNIGSGIGLSTNELLDRIREVVGKDFDIKYVDKRFCDVRKNCLDVSLAKEDFGWEPRIEIGEGIDEVIQWIGDNWKTILSEPLEYIHKE